MSTRDVALPIIPRSGDPSKTSNRLMRMLAQYRPFQGWSSFIFLVFMLLILAESITEAGWVNQPDLPAVIFWAALAGLVMSKARLPALLLHPLGLALGFLVAVRALVPAGRLVCGGHQQRPVHRPSAPRHRPSGACVADRVLQLLVRIPKQQPVDCDIAVGSRHTHKP